MPDSVLWERDGGVGRITLNRPESLNAWDRELGEELQRFVLGEAHDPAVRSVLISGAGRAFSSGADLKSTDVDLHPDDNMPDIGRRLRELYNPIITGVRELPKPVIAAVQGSAAGIGCSLALSCDLVLAADDASFLLAFARIGLMPDGGATLTVPARVGKARALEMAMLAEPVPAVKALEWGLINAVHPAGELVGAADELARRLAAGPTRAYAETKQAINESLYANLPAALEHEAERQHGLFRSPDLLEGAAAFVQKRAPKFTGA